MLRWPAFHTPEQRGRRRTHPRRYRGGSRHHELTDEELSKLRPLTRLPGRPKADATKQPVSIRLSPEVVDYFKAEGPGWQTRIDAVLREYVASR
ncbi:BrnA antitoxin family protein [Allochromatium tepidum]|uniref:BrnA antitoxin family protein n=1 Tax=Allochromatium tepidum TaxID=553982 RepID=UPI003013F92A